MSPGILSLKRCRRRDGAFVRFRGRRPQQQLTLGIMTLLRGLVPASGGSPFAHLCPSGWWQDARRGSAGEGGNPGHNVRDWGRFDGLIAGQRGGWNVVVKSIVARGNN